MQGINLSSEQLMTMVSSSHKTWPNSFSYLKILRGER